MTDTDTNRETAARSADENAWEEGLIADLRANGGRASQGPLKGHPIIVLYSTGAKTGERRRSILTISNDGDAYVVAGTAGGSTSTPSWVANLEAHPDVEFEFGDKTYTGRAEVIREGAERDRLWDAHVAAVAALRGIPGTDRAPDPAGADRQDRGLKQSRNSKEPGDSAAGRPSERQSCGQVLGRHDRDDMREPRRGVGNDRSVDHVEPVDPVDASEVVDDIAVGRRRTHPARPHNVRYRVGVLDHVPIPGQPVR